MSAQIQVMAWLRIEDNPLFKPMVTQIYGATRPYWIKKTLTKININRLRNNAGWCTTGYFLIYIIILTCIFVLFCFVSFHWIAMLRKNPITITMGLWTHVFPSLKWKHFDEIFVIGHTGSCHGENFSGLVLQEYLDIGTKNSRIMKTSSNGNIFCVTGHFRGELTGHRRIPPTEASDAKLWYFLWSAPEWAVDWIVVRLVIWDAIAPIMTSQ